VSRVYQTGVPSGMPSAVNVERVPSFTMSTSVRAVAAGLGLAVCFAVPLVVPLVAEATAGRDTRRCRIDARCAEPDLKAWTRPDNAAGPLQSSMIACALCNTCLSRLQRVGMWPAHQTSMCQLKPSSLYTAGKR
jgi:hypothetical protein